jgi:hypothetical protein
MYLGDYGVQLQKYENLVGIVYFAYGGWLEGWVIFLQLLQYGTVPAH